MAKDPAFLFYPNDFDCATKFFTDAQLGIYIRLLISQFQHGHLHKSQVLFISKNFDELIMKEFKVDENGKFYNERLENEIVRRKNFTESRRKNRKQVNNISKSYDKHMMHHMETETETETITENIKSNKVTNGKNFEYNEVTTLPTNYILSIQQQMYIFHHHRIPEEKIQEAWEAFRLEKITGQTFYSSEKDIFLHFVNWFKHQKYTPIKTKDNGIDWRTELKNKTLKRLAESKRID